MIYGNTDYGVHLTERAGEDFTEYSLEELEQLEWDNVDDTVNAMRDE